MNIRDSSGQAPLHWAARSGHETVVRVLLKRGADVKIKNNPFTTTIALHVAAEFGHETVVRML